MKKDLWEFLNSVYETFCHKPIEVFFILQV